MAKMLNQLSRGDSNITVVGNMACEAMVKESDSIFHFNMIENASVVWEFLKGRKLPGIMALDRVSFTFSFNKIQYFNNKLKRGFSWDYQWNKVESNASHHGWKNHLLVYFP